MLVISTGPEEILKVIYETVLKNRSYRLRDVIEKSISYRESEISKLSLGTI
jgi:hypothetical protein